jgi:hypothetical protein
MLGRLRTDRFWLVSAHCGQINPPSDMYPICRALLWFLDDTLCYAPVMIEMIQSAGA